MGQHKFSKCECEFPGFCPVFMRRMGTDPPDWKWCQKTSPEERKSYYDLLARSPKTDNHQLVEFFCDLDTKNIDKSLYLLHYLTMSEKYNSCALAQDIQPKRNTIILEYIKNQKKTQNSLKDIQILCLGHSNKQFDTIENRDYLIKVNLNDIEAGYYSDNKWAESRGFISQKELFSSSSKFVGFTTASWNIKYKPYTRIDHFHNWETSRILLDSDPEDNVILCADIFCPCVWFPNNTTKLCVLSLFFGEYAGIIADKFMEIFDIQITDHVKVPFSNQMICHRKVYEDYRKYLVDFDVYEKIIWLTEDFGKQYIIKQKDKDYNKNLNGRLVAYLTEAINCFWHYKRRDQSIFLPNAERWETWYQIDNLRERVKWK